MFETGEGFVPPSGTGCSRIAVIGMAPAQNEVRSGIPFDIKGKAGHLYRKILSKGGIDPETLLTLNVIQCRPPNDNCETDAVREAIGHCKVHRDVIKTINPKCIVALGGLPFQVLCGEIGIESKMNYEYWSDEYQCAVIPSLHPQFLNYRKAMHLIPAVLWALKVGPSKVPRGPCRMKAIEDPSLAEFEAFAERAMKAEWVVVDIETPWSVGKSEEELDDDPSTQIYRASFACDAETAITIPWTGGFIDIAVRLLAGGNDKLFWNANFDVPRLEYQGVEVAGRIVDVMWLYHFLFPDLPRGLAHAATYYTDLPEWKSRSVSDPKYYSCCDAYATANIYIGVREHLRQRGMLDVAERHVTDLLQVLRKMSRRGILVDQEALDRFKAFLQSALAGFQVQLNEMVPREIRRIHPRRKGGSVGYIKEPKDTSGMIQIEVTDKVKENCPKCDNKKKNGKQDCTQCGGTGKRIVTRNLKRWGILEDFSPNSPDQVKDYMRAMGHKVPYSRKYERETTGKEFLQAYAANHPTAAYLLILNFRKYQKLLGTYSSWPIGADGRIHTRFSLAPATGRLSSLNPNVQNIPAEGELAEMFRDCLVAAPGHLLLRRDYVGAEAVLTGYFANDPVFMDLATKGVYTFVMAKYLGIDLDLKDPNLAEKLKQIKAENKKPKPGEMHSLYKKFKTTILAKCYGEGPDQSFERNPGVFKNRGEARALAKFFFKLFPKIEKYQEDVVEEARQTAMIKNPFGYIRWLWDIPGQDGPKAIAQRPQSTLAAIIKDRMLEMDKRPEGEFMVWQIHDELVLEVREEDVERVDAVLKEVMEAPIPQLGGLVLRTERKLGRSMRG